MASELQLNRVPFPAEDEEFRQVLKQIGGKGNVYLVGDVNRKEGECKCGLMKEFVADVFPAEDPHEEINLNGEMKSKCCTGSQGSKGECRPEVGARIRAKSDQGRAMHCAIVIFLFRDGFVSDKANRASMREVLKDVRMRTEGHGVRPALLGLVHSGSESPESGESVELLEHMLRSVFPKHPHDSIWAGHFLPKAPDCVQTIRTRVCKAVVSAQAAPAADLTPSRKRHVCWPLQQWFGRGQRNRHAAASNNQVQKGRAGNTEEGIPLQMRAEPHVRGAGNSE
ncbi:uncharacterized protein C2orf72 homolog isoform X1 [Hoplias malabaricus]|uniref:uncharacterized protein C2orf72 homolog isoform X1 n=1 Tax=Hoplias malabaricus TaxID=27720 RepID=UPI0034624D93